MIYTVTLNPALDRTLYLKEPLKYDDSNRIEKEEKYAGGKGIDVSRVLNVLGTQSITLGFVGGFTGLEIEGLLLNEGVNFDFVRIANETRTNIIINSDKQIILNALGPSIYPYEFAKFFEKLENIKDPSYIIISGSLPESLSPTVYSKIIDLMKQRGSFVVLDTDGEALRKNISHKPDIIKPNIHELSRATNKDLKDIKQIKEAATEIHNKGIKIVLVSMGAKGIMLVSEKLSIRALPPSVKVVNTIGAGDAAVAGFIHSLKEGKSLEEALKFAVATGTASTLEKGTAKVKLEKVYEIYEKVNLEYV